VAAGRSWPIIADAHDEVATDFLRQPASDIGLPPAGRGRKASKAWNSAGADIRPEETMTNVLDGYLVVPKVSLLDKTRI
jgi:transposase